MTIISRRNKASRTPTAVILAGLVLATAGLTACQRPTGDFGRATPSIVHDTLLPKAGQEIAARRRDEPVSTFNLTDDEQELRDRGWTLIRPPSSEDWIEGTRAELIRTRILPEIGGGADPDRYYALLRSDRYASSDVRYARVIADASGDADLVEPFCQVVVRVDRADQERLRALGRRDISTEEELAGAQARVWENRRYIDWSVQALRFRLKSYRQAIDALEIETPSGDMVWDANVAWKRLAAEIVRLEKGCENANRYGQTVEPRRSRIFNNWGGERAAPRK